jgi:hypothetical protein
MRWCLVRPVLSLALLALPAAVSAQTQADLQAKGSASLGPIASLNFPTGDFGSVTGGIGWGVGLQGTVGRGILTLVAEGGYDSFNGEIEIDGDAVETDDYGIWHGAVGARVTLGPIYAGGLAGYWGGDGIEDFDVMPMVGLHLWKIDVGARYKGLLGDADWFAITGAIHFGKW